ncbi:MAG TPA: cyanophycin synthetase, partial [Gammaproteobacteria bacterium]|nr:cyanophycin synthetase [Gammaproteobacteria bacterium]
EENNSWNWRGKKRAYFHLPFSQLACQNLATALMVIEVLEERLAVSEASIHQGLKTVSLPGRIEIKENLITEIVDVAHNPAAVAFLAKRLQKLSCLGRTHAVFSMLADKDLSGSLREIKNQIDEWHVAPLQVARGASQEKLKKAFEAEKITSVYFYASIQEAQQAARSVTRENDRLLIFGSFHVVAQCRNKSAFAE